MAGWIKLHRSIKNHWIFEKARPKTRLEAWLIILLEANHSDEKVLINGSLIECKRGESLNSLDTWARLFNWDKSKTRRFLKLLKTDTMVELKSTQKTTHLKVCNYDTYQGERNTDETQMKRRRTHKRHTDDTKQEDKEVNNDKESKELNTMSGSIEPRPPDNISSRYDKFIEYINAKLNRSFRGDKKSKAQFRARIKDGYEFKDWEKAIENLMKNEFHKENGYTYITPEFLTRQTILEKWINAKNEKIYDINFTKVQNMLL